MDLSEKSYKFKKMKVNVLVSWHISMNKLSGSSVCTENLEVKVTGLQNQWIKKKCTFYSWKPSATEYSPVLNDVIFFEIFYSVKLIWHCKIIV